MTDIATLGIRVDSRDVDKGKVSLDQLAKSGEGAEKSTTALTSASSHLAGAIGLVSGALAGLGISKFITETSALHQRYEQLGLILGVVGANTGNLRSEIDKTVESVKNQGISMIESRQTVLKLMQSNIELSEATKLARLAQDAATIGNVNSSQALDSLIHGVTSAQVEVLRTIGINVSFEQSYKKLADSLGVATTELTENQKMQARLNEVLGKAPDIAGAYAASMENAGKMMKSTARLTEDLKVSVGGLFDDTAMFAVTAYTESLKTLTGTMADMKKTGELKDWSQRIAIELAFVADLARTTAGIFLNLGSVVVNQINNIKNGDFSKMTQTFADSDNELKKLLGDTTKYQDAVNNRIIQEGMLTEKVTGSNNNLREQNKQIIAATTATKELTAAKEKLTVEMLRQEESTKATIDLDREVSRLTESVMTKQERYNKTLEELNRLKPYLSVETYSRALEKAQTELEGVAKATKTTTDDVSQLWVQAGRNIQSTLSNSIFDFFNSGLDGMLANVKNTVLRIASEFAGLKLAQGLGIANIFGGGSGVANAGGIGGAGSILSGLTSLGSGAMSMFNSGFGIPSIVGRGMSMLPGALGAFGTGMLGTAGAGAFSAVGGAGTAFIGGAGTALGGTGMGVASGLGASLSAAAGPLAIAAVADVVFRMLAGNKTTGSKIIDSIPVIGSLGALLFGHGPRKFRQEVAIGEVSSAGFDGRFTRVDRAKGGLMVGNKHWEYDSPNSAAFQEVFDMAIQGYAKSAMSFADNLGLSTKAVTGYSKTIRLESEKNKALTEEQISGFLTEIGNDFARGIIPTIDGLAKSGENAFQTLTRLNTEFVTLAGSAQLLFNMSAEQAKAFVNGFGLADKTGFLDSLGGIDAFSQKMAAVANGFLTEDQRMRPTIESLVARRDAVGGLGGINTREQYSAALQSGKMSVDQMAFLIDNAATADAVFKYFESKAQESTSLIELEKTKADQIKAQTLDFSGVAANWQKEIDKLLDSVGKLKDFSKELAESVLQLQPMTRNEALQQILGYATAAANGGPMDINDIKAPLSTLTNINASDYGSQLDFARDRARSVNAVNSLIGVSDAKQGDLASAIESMKEAMTEALASIAKSTGQTADILDNVTAGGGPMLTTAA